MADWISASIPVTNIILYFLFIYLFYQVLFLDPVQEDSIELIRLAELFYKHKIPLRSVSVLTSQHIYETLPLSSWYTLIYILLISV